MTGTPKNLGVSILARLRNVARDRGDDPQLVLMQFVLERLLHRLGQSAHFDQFLLKGAMLFAAWANVPHRATHDLDLLGLPTPRLRTYPRETVVAEKFQAMVSLGELNSRMKDFYDVFVLARRFEFEATTLAEAIRGTFVRRSTELPATEPIALLDQFATLEDKQVQWAAFVRRSRLLDPATPLATVVAELRTFLWPVVCGLRGTMPMPGSWRAGGPWSPG